MKAFVNKIYSKKIINKIKKKLIYLGKTKINYVDFLSTRFVITLILFTVLLFFTNIGYFYAPIISLAFYIGIEYLLIDRRIKNRIVKLDNDALFFFQVMMLSLEAGRNLKIAIEVTSDNVDSELSNEFKKCVEEMKMGKTLNETLNDLKKRLPSPTIKNVILNISESNVYGSSITETLNIQIDYLRDKKILGTKAIINKLPIKMSIISVLFFIPIILLLVLAPVIISLFG